jgi:hypothetical protein
MKISRCLLVPTLAVALLGCANKKETMVESNDPTLKTTHTQEELRKTGESQVAPALEKVDASVQTSHR